jgi:hypothetical protein
MKSAGSLSITRSSISRHGIAIANDIVKKIYISDGQRRQRFSNV